MLDLDRILEETIDIKIKGQVIKVNQPNVKMVKKISNIGKVKDIDPIEAQIDLICEILNNNKDGLEVSKLMIEDLPQKALVMIMNEIGKNLNNLEKN